ncbi:hypothetical protein BDQ12DRAFT_261594 [Crucibulum laeve]|uniref:Uncharacterized protein n=1 Tax=Crucibulum laeve TaxID=68775 RepID=A0A5C3LVI4_9AGAR|nr:hypothetical protein BDQ12DRAFT_261594 [Crucibulum laeve]
MLSATSAILISPLLCIFALAAPLICNFSCPASDTDSHVLIRRPNAIPFVSDYSLFECIYGVHGNIDVEIHTCSYDKVSGKQILSYAANHCPEEAISCSGLDSPLFSSEGEKTEDVSWVENGRWLLHMKEHPSG